MKKLILASAALIVLGSTPVLAQTVVEKSTTVNPDNGAVTEHTTTVEKKPGGTGPGAVGGAAAGAVVAGPVGAVVGGVAGAVVGHSVAPTAKQHATTKAKPTAIMRAYLPTQSRAPSELPEKTSATSRPRSPCSASGASRRAFSPTATCSS